MGENESERELKLIAHTIAESKRVKIGGYSRIQQDIVRNVNGILQLVANLAEFSLREIFDDSVQKEYEVLSNLKGG